MLGMPVGHASSWVLAEGASARRDPSVNRSRHRAKLVDLGSVHQRLVPREDTKTKQVEWMVFLSEFALRQFRALHEITKESRWCFPASQSEGHLSVKAISKQIGDRQFKFKNRKPLKNRRNDNSLVLIGAEWTPHDLRRTGSTLMQSLGVPEHIRERCLNHAVGGKLGRVYGRYEFANEKRDAWNRLGRHLEAMLK